MLKITRKPVLGQKLQKNEILRPTFLKLSRKIETKVKIGRKNTFQIHHHSL